MPKLDTIEEPWSKLQGSSMAMMTAQQYEESLRELNLVLRRPHISETKPPK